MTVQPALQQGRLFLRKLALDPRVHLYGRAAAYIVSGFLLSAASLGNAAMPIAMGFVCGCSGWSAVLAALGSAAGYTVFWGSYAQQSVLWIAAGLLISLFLQGKHITRESPFLLPAVAGLVVSATGVLFQVWLSDTTPVGIYMLRVAMAAGSTWLFYRVLQGRHPILDWLTCALAVLALA